MQKIFLLDIVHYFTTINLYQKVIIKKSHFKRYRKKYLNNSPSLYMNIHPP